MSDRFEDWEVEGEEASLSVFMFERNKGEWSRGRECLCQRCVRDHLFLLGQNTSLGPPAEEEAGCVCGAVFKAGRGKTEQRKKTPKGLRMVINRTQVRPWAPY